MSIIRDAIDRIANMAENKTYQIDGQHYSDNSLVRIEPPRYSPKSAQLSSLDSLVKMLTREIDKLSLDICPIFVRVSGHDAVEAYGSYDDRFERSVLYKAVSDVPTFDFGWKDYDAAMIALRSQFLQTTEITYILDLLSRVSDEDSVASADNGLSQTVEARKGIALKQVESVRPHVALTPYRTFLEVAQPESTFLLRLREGGQIGLFEADGGMWRLTARRTIAAYLEQALSALIESSRVVVTI